MRSKKYSFLLLELLIALSLFSLCILPLIQLPFNALSSEIKSCQRIHLQRLADLTFAEIEGQLFQNQIPWEDLDCKRDEKTQLLKDVQVVHLKGIGDRAFERKCSIWTSRKKEGADQERHHLITLELSFKSTQDRFFFFKKKNFSDQVTFRHQAYVTRLPSAP
jgi:hypothetical protein